VVFGRQEAYVGDSELSPVSAPTGIPPSPSLSETMQVVVSRASEEEKSALGVPAWEKMAEAPILVEAVVTQMGQSFDLRTRLVRLP
jgi:hypothetical protein